VYIYPILLIFPFIRGDWRRLQRYLAVVIFVSGSILGLWLGYAAYSGILEQQWATLSYSAGYFVKTVRGKTGEGGWFIDAFLFRLPSGIGLYNFPLLVLGGWSLVQRRDSATRLLFVWIAAVFLPLMLTVPGPRYFFPAFPALTIMMARGLDCMQGAAQRIITLALLYGAGALYLFVDWSRTAGDFLPP
jgi:hypothetical protein